MNERHTPIALLLGVLGIAFLLLGIVFNPLLLGFFSSDRSLAHTTVGNIYHVEKVFFLYGVVVLLVAVFGERRQWWSRMMAWQRTVNILIALSLVIFLLVVLENVLGVIFVSKDDSQSALSVPAVPENENHLFEYDPLLGWANKPGATSTFVITDSSTFVSINARGMRQLQQVSDRKVLPRILFLGDSFTWGFGVGETERFTDLVSVSLRGKAEVLNAGVSGYGPDQEYLYYKERAASLDPDVVVVVFGFDDISDMAKQGSGKPYFDFGKDGKLGLHNVPVPKPDETVQGRGLQLQKSPLQSMLEQSNIYKFIVKKVLRVFAQQKADRLSRALLIDFKREVKSHGGQFVILWKPDWSLVSQRYNVALYKSYMQFFSDNHISVIDPLERLEARNRESRVFLEHDAHWNPEGHRIVGDVVLEFLKSHHALGF